MKKICVSILAILLAVLLYMLIAERINIGKWQNNSLKDIKKADAYLDNKINKSIELSTQIYPSKIEERETEIKNLKIAKEKYLLKTSTLSESIELGIIEIKEYKIERLWIALANYANKYGTDLVLELAESNTTKANKNGTELYNLNITVAGTYIGITDFIYAIENDDTLNFKIENFKILPQTVPSGENTKNEGTGEEEKHYDETGKLEATFVIKDVSVDLQ